MFETITIQQMWMILIGMIVCFVSFFALLVYWYRKNNIQISIDEWEDGLLNNRIIRCREKKPKVRKKYFLFGKDVLIPGKYLRFKDFIGLQPIKHIVWEKVHDKMFKVETNPLIGVTHNLNLYKAKTEQGFEYLAWSVDNPDTYKKGLINNVRIVEINMLREELYDSTDSTTTADKILKIILPLALMILALACLIFFPKIYNTIIQNDAAIIEAAKVKWTDFAKELKPFGGI